LLLNYILELLKQHDPEGNGEPLAIVLRPGNAGSNTAADHIEAARLALAQLALQRWWAAWSKAPPPRQLQILIDSVAVGRGLHLYIPNEQTTVSHQLRSASH
jgi:hypothetical protein